LDKVIKGFHEKKILESNVHEKNETVNRTLCALIQTAEGTHFPTIFDRTK